MGKNKLEWEVMETAFIDFSTERLKIKGGWLVRSSVAQGVGLTFVPDPKHEWKLEVR